MNFIFELTVQTLCVEHRSVEPHGWCRTDLSKLLSGSSKEANKRYGGGSQMTYHSPGQTVSALLCRASSRSVPGNMNLIWSTQSLDQNSRLSKVRLHSWQNLTLNRRMVSSRSAPKKSSVTLSLTCAQHGFMGTLACTVASRRGLAPIHAVSLNHRAKQRILAKKNWHAAW